MGRGVGAKTCCFNGKRWCRRAHRPQTVRTAADELPLPHYLQVEMCLAASKLENKDTFSKSDPFVRISKARESGAWVPVLKTEVGTRLGLDHV